MKRLLLILASAGALWSAACSGGGGTTVLPPPTGKFSNSSLNGTYAFVTNGEVVTTSGASAILARTGSFVANGNAGIMGGVEDTVTQSGAGSQVNTDVTITGGGYSVGADGRGSVTLNVVSGGVPSTITFGITLTSASGGLLIDETFTASQASTGSGNFFKQDTTAFTTPVLPVTATYVFDFAGFDGSQNPASLVGEFTAGSGALTGGFEDVNDAFVLTNGTIPSGGTLIEDPLAPATLTGNGRGLAQIAGESYVFYIVDATRIRFISTSGGAALTGDAVAQTNPPASLSSGFAFVVAGTTSAGGGLTRVGRFTASGATVNNILVDTNNAGMFPQTNGGTNASLTLDPSVPGRGTLTFVGNGQSANTPFSFVFYLTSATSGVIQETTSNTSGGVVTVVAVADGSIGAQTGNPFSSSNITGTYALNWTGQSVQSGTTDEEDVVGQATVSNLALSGAADIFQFQSVFINNTGAQTDNAVTGSILFNGGDGTGDDGKRSTMTVTLTKNGQATTVNFVVYFVSPQLAYFANTSTSSTRLVAGILEVQP